MKKEEILNNLVQIEKDKNNLPFHYCKITNEKWLNDLTEENEILKDRVRHLENLLNLQDIIGNIDKVVNFKDSNHKTIRTDYGNLITYYTK